jgi:hypothetical protein
MNERSINMNLAYTIILIEINPNCSKIYKLPMADK